MDRERSADVASLRARVPEPASVAVVGASRGIGTVGRAVLHNIVTGGYQGRIYAVNPHAAHMEAVTCVASFTALPEPVDLAVIAGRPPPPYPIVADECGRRGVKALVVITAGLDTPQGADLLAICRRYGMRLVGPNCFGIAVPSIGLDATFAARHPPSPDPRAWSCSPAGWASPWAMAVRWASASRPSPRSATSTTSPATTC